MGQILKFPVQGSKFGYKRARKRTRNDENPDQLQFLFDDPAKILRFFPEASSFERALMFDEREDRIPGLGNSIEAIEEGNCAADACCNLGIIESRNGNTSKAFDYFTTALKHNPRHFEAHYNLGNLYFDVNDFRLAQIHYEMAIEVDSTFSNLYFNLALVQAINNDIVAAAITLAKSRNWFQRKRLATRTNCCRISGKRWLQPRILASHDTAAAAICSLF